MNLKHWKKLVWRCRAFHADLFINFSLVVESSGEAAVEETVHVPELVVEKEEISEKLSKQEKAKRKKV